MTKLRPDDRERRGGRLRRGRRVGRPGVSESERSLHGLPSGGIGRDELTGAGAAQVYDGLAELLAALPESLLGS
jgi:hypothetical protein